MSNDDTLKAEVSRIAETIFRRVEFDGSLHKSSLEDELYRWAREMLQPTIEATPVWVENDKGKQRKKENDLLQAIYGAAKTSTLYNTAPPTHTHSITSTAGSPYQGSARDPLVISPRALEVNKAHLKPITWDGEQLWCDGRVYYKVADKPHTHSITTTGTGNAAVPVADAVKQWQATPTCTIRRKEFEILVKAGHIDVRPMKLSKLSDAPLGFYIGCDESKYRLID